MIDERGVLTCDVCGRQIVSIEANDKHIVGPKSEAIHLSRHNTHACGICKMDPLLRSQEGLNRYVGDYYNGE